MTIRNQDTVAKIIAIVAGICLVAVVFVNVASKAEPAKASTVFAGPTIGQVATTSAAFSVTTSARVLATTTNPLDPINSYLRVYATICTTSSNPVALNLDGDKAANANGAVTAWIAAAAGYNACYQVDDRNPYMGSITASSTNQTATVITVKDYVTH